MAEGLLRVFERLALAASDYRRSGIGAPFVWLAGIAAAAWVICVQAESVPIGIKIGASVVAGTRVIGVMALLATLALTNPDALRGETYNLKRTAMERNLVGDNVIGLIIAEPPSEATAAQLPQPNEDSHGR